MRRGRGRCKVFSISLIFVIFVSVLFGAFYKRLEKPFESAFSAYASEIGNEAIHYAVYECFANVSHENLVTMTYNPAGEVVSVSANTAQMNRIKSDLNSKVKEYLSKSQDKYVTLYFGAVQDNPMFSSFGPRFKVRVKPYGITKVSFRDEFVSAGINQARHCIYADICAKITLVTFTSKHSFEVNNTIIVSDTVIVGGVPQLYGGYYMGLNNKLE